MVHGRVVLVVVDPERHRDVGVLRRRGDDDLLGARLEVQRGLVALGEEARALDDDVHAQVAPRQVGGVALGEHLHLFAVHVQVVVVRVHVPGIPAEDRVVLQQVGEGRGVGDVVDRDDLQVGLTEGRGPEDVAADPPEAVDAHPYAHCGLSVVSEAE